MGAGKTSVGAELAHRLGWQFRDLDDLIEARAGITIPEIFSLQGEVAFRQAEAVTLTEFLSSTRQTSVILALGGGAFAQDANREALRRAHARIVLLTAPVAELWHRCSTLDKKVRPLLGDEKSFQQLFSERLPAYQRADLTVSTEQKSVSQVATEIESSLALVSR